MLTQRGANQVFQFFYCQKFFFGQRGRTWPIWPRGKYATVYYTVNFSEVFSDLVIVVFIEEKYLTHPMSLLIILVAACECVIVLFVWQ